MNFFWANNVKEPSAAAEPIMTAIFHCGHEEAGSPERKQANAVSCECHRLGRPDKDDSPRSHSAGFLRGMAISVGLCKQKSITQPVASRASTNKGCEWTLGSARAWELAGWYVWNDLAVKPKGHSSNHETLMWSCEKCDKPFLPGVNSKRQRSMVSTPSRRNNLLLCFHWSKIKASGCFRLGALFAEHQSWIPIYARGWQWESSRNSRLFE